MNIKKEERVWKRRRVVSPAGIKEVPTGESIIQEIQQKDGTIKKETRPLVDRVQVDAVVDYVDEVQEIFCIDSPSGDVHEFANEEDAKRFIKEST